MVKRSGDEWRTLLSAGAASGMTQVAAGVSMYLAGVYFEVWSLVVSLAVLLVALALSVWWCAHRLGVAPPRPGRILVTGLVVSLLTGALYGLYNVVSINFVYDDFLNEMVQARVALQQGRDIDPARLSVLAAELRASTSAWRIAATNFVLLSFTGIVASAVWAGWAVLRRGISRARRVT